MRVEETSQITCPFCFEQIELRLDASGGTDQSFVYDCEVCCRPIELRVRFLADGFEVEASRAYD